MFTKYIIKDVCEDFYHRHQMLKKMFSVSQLCFYEQDGIINVLSETEPLKSDLLLKKEDVKDLELNKEYRFTLKVNPVKSVLGKKRLLNRQHFARWLNKKLELLGLVPLHINIKFEGFLTAKKEDSDITIGIYEVTGIIKVTKTCSRSTQIGSGRAFGFGWLDFN